MSETELKKVDGRSTRKRSPRPAKTNRKSPGASAKLKAKWQDPEWRAMMMEKRKAAGAIKKQTRSFRQGVPDGMRKAEADRLWAKASRQADRFIKIMEDAGELPEVVLPGSEEEMGKEALREACRFALSPLTDMKNKAAYIRMVLDFTKAKPESKSKITLDKSEEWLAEVAKDMAVDDGRDGA